MKTLPLFFCLFLFLFSASVQASSMYHFYTPLIQCNVLEPDVIFKEGINGTAYTISTNKTWAEVNVAGTGATTYYECMLNITNPSFSTAYQAKLEIVSTDGVSRLTNFTAYLNDGTTSKQVEISNGEITKPKGSYHSLATSATIYLSLAIRVGDSGSSTVDLRLHVVKNGTTSPEIIQTVRVNVN